MEVGIVANMALDWLANIDDFLTRSAQSLVLQYVP